ncbi:GNAT family N-acetyltransferase [Taibaiella chishuiensis]|uniref:Phosphinothricin acetyltransferase n=1 Tax=Taibaiella chishuiensis TaxID=1434707 RepID=A0A2P8D846_9BACT|nr:GNAT family N-acetyltransferase [Taibaiella chishuiensis]PSK93367.1 phosphinothricin acetyltransferase [Taibaiella chishuiensis]
MHATDHNAPLHIRPATEADVPGILEIYNDAILHTTAIYNYVPHSPDMRLAWLRERQEQGFPVLVADSRGAVAGYSSLGPFRAFAAYKYTAESSVYVHPEHRGKGIAKMLMPPLIEAAKAMDLHTIVAGIDASNAASIKLHEQFGFEQVAHFKQVGYKFDQWLDLLFLQLLLPTPAAPVAI